MLSQMMLKEFTAEYQNLNKEILLMIDKNNGDIKLLTNG